MLVFEEFSCFVEYVFGNNDVLYKCIILNLKNIINVWLNI